MKKDEMFNKKLADRLNTCISEKFKHNSEFIRELNRQHGFPVNNTRQGECFILESRLNQILKGKKDKAGNRHYEKLDYDYALGFSKVLRVPVEYLMGEIDYPSEKAKEEAEFIDAIKAWDKEDQEIIATFKRVMSLLSEKQFMFCFELKEEYTYMSPIAKRECTSHAQLCCNNMQYTLIDNGMQIIPESEFFSWLTNNTGTIKHSSNKWYHLNNKILVISNNKSIELDIDKFMIMIHDIDESIKATVQNRCDFWMKYSDYDYKEALRKEV